MPDGATRRRSNVTRAALLRIQEMLRSGQLAPGQALPSQRQLAQELQVSRASLREALSILDTLGMIRIEQGRGTFVVAPDAVADGEANGPWHGTWRFAARYTPEEVYQFRAILEPSAAALAAQLVTDEEIARLEQCLRAFKEATREMDLVASSERDFEFHVLILRFARNRMLADLHGSYRQLLLESQRLPLARRSRLWEPVSEHERILQALAMRDPDGAAYYMRTHIHRAADRSGIRIDGPV